MKNSPAAADRDKKREVKIYFSIFVSIGASWVFGFIMLLFPENNAGRLLFLTLYSLTTPLEGQTVTNSLLTIKGFLVFGAYCLNKKVASRWARLLGRPFPYFKRWENLENSYHPKSTTASSRA